MKHPQLFVALLLLSCSIALRAHEQPNIIFILTDDHRYDAFSFMDHSVVETPNLDRLRADGIQFENAFVPTSICSPSRASVLTSTYAHEHGVIDHSEREINFDEQTTFAKELQDAGYHTALIGKWHMAKDPNPRPGFDHWISFSGQGVYNNPKLNENGRDFRKKGYITDILNDYALEYIRERSAEDEPFMLYLSHKAMHGPFTPPARHKHLYDDRPLPTPESWSEDISRKPEWKRFKRGSRVVRAPREVPEVKGNGPWDKRSGYMKKVIPNYLRTVNAVDDGVGAILDELEELGELDNTLIIYMGDNGFFNGEHGLLDKRYAYEESIRIPMIARYPKAFAPGSSSDAMVLNIDVGPTILEAAEVDAPSQFKGRSMIPLNEATPEDWRKRFLYSYWQEYMPNIPSMLGVRNERYKYVTYPYIDDISELYDLENDPNEMNNLFQDDAYQDVVAQMQAELQEEVQQIGFQFEVPDPNQRYADWPTASGVLFAFEANEGAGPGQVKNVKFKDGVAHFNGKGNISYDLPKSVNPIQLPYRIKAKFKATANGTIFSCGNEHAGYGLVVKDGRVNFLLTKEQSIYILEGKDAVIDEWVDVEVEIDPLNTTLFVNGVEQVKHPIRAPFIVPVQGPLLIGKNTLEFSKRFGINLKWPNFQGELETVTILR